jgi:hypothetical protein
VVFSNTQWSAQWSVSIKYYVSCAGCRTNTEHGFHASYEAMKLGIITCYVIGFVNFTVNIIWSEINWLFRQRIQILPSQFLEMVSKERPYVIYFLAYFEIGGDQIYSFTSSSIVVSLGRMNEFSYFLSLSTACPSIICQFPHPFWCPSKLAWSVLFYISPQTILAQTDYYCHLQWFCFIQFLLYGFRFYLCQQISNWNQHTPSKIWVSILVPYIEKS